MLQVLIDVEIFRTAATVHAEFREKPVDFDFIALAAGPADECSAGRILPRRCIA